LRNIHCTSESSTSTTTVMDGETINPTYPQTRCVFFEWSRGLCYEYVERQHLKTQGHESKANLFSNIMAEHQVHQEVGRQNLERLRQLDAVAATHFEVKPSLVDGMTFRLLDLEASNPPESYIALSYRWMCRSSSETEPPGMISIPVDPLLFQQLIRERHSGTEGIWCDQVCINQTDVDEKMRIIGAMDAIYKCARLVVIALQDIEATLEEFKFLEAFNKDYSDSRWPYPPPHLTDSPPYMAQNPVLRQFFYKICKSEYFTRAWCSHELRMGQTHTFIIKCASSIPGLKAKVCSITGQFLGYLAMLSSRVQSPDQEVLNIRLTLLRIFHYNRNMSRSLRTVGQASEDQITVAPYPPQVMEVFALKASGNPDAADRERDANLDRMAIVLNSSGSGLVLDRAMSTTSPHTSSRDHCKRLLLLVALAAGDPISLCTMGKALRLGSTEQSSSWLCAPHFADVGLGPHNQDALRLVENFRCQLDSSPLAEWIRLDCLSLGIPERASDRSAATAEKIITKCLELGLGGGFLGRTGAGPQYSNWRIQTDYPGNKTAFLMTVAALLDFGPGWMLGMSRKCGFDDDSVVREMRSAMSTHFADGFDHGYLNSLTWATSESATKAVNWLLSTATFMRTVLAAYVDGGNMASWIPYIHARGWSKKVLIFGPSDALITPVIPLALLNANYSRLPRVWLLQDTGDPSGERRETGHRPRLFLRTKSILFGNVSENDYQSQLKSQFIQHGLQANGPVEGL
jgi:hypothetical protein